MTAKTDIIGKAAAWVQTVWQEARSNWTGRVGQDREYRTHVIHPAVCGLLAGKFPGGGLRILELGCGDGVLLESSDFRQLIGDDGKYHGIDLSDTLLDSARSHHDSGAITFQQGDIADPSLPDSVNIADSDVDVVVSVFVIQEVPDLDIYMQNLARLTPPGALTVTVTVHPDFADWLREEGRVKVEEELGGDAALSQYQWRWAGYYPIVDEVNGAFYLPHFQRTVEDYKHAMARHGFKIEQTVDLPEPIHDLPRLVQGGVPPFTPFAENHYWPRISEAPSALIISARKEADSA